MLSRLFALRRLKPPGTQIRIGVRSCGAVGGHLEKLRYYDSAHSLKPTIENLFAHGGVGGVGGVGGRKVCPSTAWRARYSLGLIPSHV